MWFEIVIAAGLCFLGFYLYSVLRGDYAGIMWGLFLVPASFAGAVAFSVGAALLRLKGRIAWVGQFVLIAFVAVGVWFLSCL
jgi:hypothetical protein